MRGDEQVQEAMFSYVSPAQRVPQSHPLRPIRKMVDAALKELSPEFEKMYSDTGRPSVPPEQWITTCCFVRPCSGLRTNDEIWDATVFTKNRDRMLEADVARLFFERVLDQASQLLRALLLQVLYTVRSERQLMEQLNQLLSNEHFTVDGTLVEAWAGQKSFKKKTGKKPGPPDDRGTRQ